MTRGPGWLFVGGLIVFALLGLLAGAPPERKSESPAANELNGTHVSPPTRGPEPTSERITIASSRSPAALARAWGNLSANWSDRSLPSRLRAMAESASPRLAADLERALAATPEDGALAPRAAGSRGIVEAVEVRGTGGSRRVLVVTRERPATTGADELVMERYRVYIGVAVRGEGRVWRMARWQRQP